MDVMIMSGSNSRSAVRRMPASVGCVSAFEHLLRAARDELRRIRSIGINAARCEFPQKLLVVGISEVLDARNDADLVPTLRKRFHQ